MILTIQEAPNSKHEKRTSDYNNVNKFSIYIGKSDLSVWLRLKMSYEGDDWIFFERAYLSYGGNTHEIKFDKYKDSKTDNGYGGRVWEWVDVRVDDATLKFLVQMAQSNDVKMRMVGKYAHTRKLTKQEIQGVRDVLTAYHVLNDEG